MRKRFDVEPLLRSKFLTTALHSWRYFQALLLLGWIVALGTMAAVVFSTYSQFKEGGEYWSASAHSAYDTLARPAWAAAVGWIVYTCSTGNGGGTFFL